MPRDVVDYLLKGCDTAKSLLESGAAFAPGHAEPTEISAPQVPQSFETKVSIVPEASPSSGLQVATDNSPMVMDLMKFVLKHYSDLDRYYSQQGRELDRDLMQRQICDFMRRSKDAA